MSVRNPRANRFGSGGAGSPAFFDRGCDIKEKGSGDNAATMHGTQTRTSASRTVAFERQLGRALEGEVRFDEFTRGRYATDASIYQIVPQGVAFPTSEADVAAALQIAGEHGVPVIARGGGTSQNGQPIGDGLILDMSRHFNTVTAYDPEKRTVSVAPGMVLEHLNARVKADGLFFPVEPSTASRCTLGGMIGNNSSGARSLRYGKTVDNVLSMRALFHDGEPFALSDRPVGDNPSLRARDLMTGMLALADRERAEIERMYPEGAAAGRRLQPRRTAARAAEPLAPAGRLRRHTRDRHRDRAQALEPARAPRDGGLPFPELPRRDGDDAAPRRARPGRGRARRQQRAGARRRHPALQAHPR